MLGLCARAGCRTLSAGVLAACMCLATQCAGAAESGQIDIAYLPPKDPAHRPLYELLMSKHVLE
jgi:hypothetical protein